MKTLLTDDFLSTHCWPGSPGYRKLVKHRNNPWAPDELYEFMLQLHATLPDSEAPDSWYKGDLISDAVMAKCFSQAKVSLFT
jgi:hypothetical protein